METQQSIGNKGISTFLSFGAKNVQPEILEKMLVGRQKAVNLLEQYGREIAQNGVNYQVFIVGPRGAGKTHLLRVLYHRINDLVQTRTIVVAYFAEEEYGISGYLDFLIRIINAFMRWYDDDRAALEAQLDILRETPVSRQEYVAETIIGEYVGDKPLLILSENFDTILEALNKQGQAKLRAWLYRHNRISIIATAQATSPDLGREDRPFYGFFSTISLKKLTYEESLELLMSLARIEQNKSMIAHLNGPGKAQVEAIHELVKGNHRLLVTFYEFLKADSVADLSLIFMKTMNDLKPYYETFIRFLPAQQQKILYYVALAKTAQKGTDIAKNCFIATTSLTKQLSELQRRRLIDALPDPDDKRNKLYDVAEPLLRIAIEIGEQREGITALFIDFLALYYSHEEIRSQKIRFESLYLNEVEPLKKQKFFYEMEARDRALQLKLHFDKSLPKHQSRQPEQRHDVQSSETSADSVEEDNAAHYFQLGNTYYDRGDYAQAVVAYEKVLAINPDDADTWNNLGNTYLHQGDYAQAMVAYEKVLAINPDDADTWNNLGITYGSQGDYVQAVVAFDKALTIDSDHADIWYNLGVNYYNQGDYTQAVAAHNKALIINPDHAKAWNNLGTTYDNQGDYLQAVVAYEKALAINPDDAKAWNNLGVTYYNQGDYFQAVMAYRRAIEIQATGVGSVVKKLTDTIVKFLQTQTATELELTELETWLNDRAGFEIISTYVNVYRRVVFAKEEKALYDLPKEQRVFFKREILKKQVE